MRTLLAKYSIAGLLISLSVALAPLAYSDVAGFQRVSAKTLAKEKFSFPGDLKADQLNVLFVAISDSQEAGEHQGEILRGWHAQLAAQGLFTESVLPYHFPVMEGVPFFVKGLVARGMRGVYEDLLPLQQVVILHVDNTADFAGTLSVLNDQEPTVILISNAGQVLETFHGNDIDVSALAAAISANSRQPEVGAD